MAKWLIAALLVLQAHVTASCLVPLDANAQRTFGGLAVVGIWVPFGLWRSLACAGAALSLALMALVIGPTKLLPRNRGSLFVAISAHASVETPQAAGLSFPQWG
jgi:hypothetical protein